VYILIPCIAKHEPHFNPPKDFTANAKQLRIYLIVVKRSGDVVFEKSGKCSRQLRFFVTGHER
jgi:hypothetical protein